MKSPRPIAASDQDAPLADDAGPRLAGESAHAYSMFCTFVSLGPHRSLAATAAQVGRAPGTLANLASTYHWTARAQQADAAQADAAWRALAAERLVTTQRLLDRGRVLADVALDLIRARERWSARDLIRLLRLAVDIEETALALTATVAPPATVQATQQLALEARAGQYAAAFRALDQEQATAPVAPDAAG